MSKKKDFLLELVRRRPVHLTAEQIYLLAKAELPSLSMATVYNNLGALASEGKIRRIHIVGQADRYDRSTAPHEHMVCDGCGEISDLSIPNFTKALSEETGVPVLSYELNIHYLCQTCQEGNQ